MIKNILFDFDGTIANTAPGIIATMAETFRQMGHPIPSNESMRQTIGLPLIKALQMVNKLSDDEALHAVDVYTELFHQIEIGMTTIYPNVAETLDKITKRNIRMAIVTSRNRESLYIILNRFNLLQYFEILFTNDNRKSFGNDVLRPKPAPDMALALLELMNITAYDTLVVGDTTFDIDMGNNALCSTCAVTYGNHTRVQLLSSSPTFIIDDFADLLSIV